MKRRLSVSHIILIATALAVLANLSTSVCNWIGWYRIAWRGLNHETYRILSMNYYEWANLGRQILKIHFLICLLFEIVMTVFLFLRKTVLKSYIKGILFFYCVQIITAYFFLILFDVSAVTGGLHNLTDMPYRLQRMACLVMFSIVGAFMSDGSFQKRKIALHIPKVILFFSATAIFINLAAASCKLTAAQILKSAGSNSFYRILNLTYDDWMNLCSTLRLVHFFVYLLFVLVTGILLLKKHFSLEQYTRNLFVFHFSQVIISCLFSAVWDLSGTSDALHNLVMIPHRFELLTVMVLFGIAESLISAHKHEKRG